MSQERPLCVPKTFRVLVIDDQICNELVCLKKVGVGASDVKNLIKRYITSEVNACAVEKNAKIDHVDVVFAQDPDEGVSEWMGSIFDLTLVDSDFSRSETMRKAEKQKRNFLDLNLEFVGAYLFRFLREMLLGKEFGDIRKGCRVALWTGLGLDDDNKVDRARRLISILPHGEVESPICFIPKKECDIGRWQELGLAADGISTISKLIKEMAEANPALNPNNSNIVTPEVIIGRIKSLYCKKSPEEFSALCDFRECVYSCWLEVKGGKVVLSNKKTDGSKLLSPLLRRDMDNDDCEIASNDDDETVELKREVSDFFSKTLIDIRKNDKGIITQTIINSGNTGDQLQHEVLSDKASQKLKEHIIAAATPLTGCSSVGHDYSISLMVKKIKALLDGPFGKVVLKTVYLDSLTQWHDMKWPEVQAQESHLTRCLRSTRHTRTLWNTGQTSMEAFTPKMMHGFLIEMPAEYRRNIIVSLGSKFPQAKQKNLRQENCRNKLLEIWGRLFDDVFHGISDTDYPLVEINVRHYLRECIEANLGGHEYLSPAKISESFAGNYTAVDEEFRTWLSVLNETAMNHGKRLLLKLPFRGDIYPIKVEKQEIGRAAVLSRRKHGKVNSKSCRYR